MGYINLPITYLLKGLDLTTETQRVQISAKADYLTEATLRIKKTAPDHLCNNFVKPRCILIISGTRVLLGTK